MDFGECEEILRGNYELSSSSIITFIPVLIGNNKEQYYPYNKEKGFLDMSLCKGVTIKQVINLKNMSNLDLSEINKYNEKGIDPLNVNDPFFNEICYSYSESDNDIILEDRRKDIYQNFTGCSEGCKYNNINTEDMTAICGCIMKDENFTLDLNSSNYDEFEEISLLDSNIGVIKCYKLVFSFEGKLNNIGFWIFTISLIANFVFLFLYFHNGIKNIIEYLFNEMINYGYLRKSNRKFFEEEKKDTIKTINQLKKNIKKIKIYLIQLEKEKKIKRIKPPL